MRRRCIDMSGKRVGFLSVLARSRTAHKLVYWRCKCECGREIEYPTHTLKRGLAKSCGCIKGTKGRGALRLHRIWRGMCTRSPITSPEVLAIYRGPGTRAPEWRSFSAFEKWAIENGYADNLTIDRIDNHTGYFPENCRWATIEQQANNKTTNVCLTVEGKTLTLSQAAREYGLSASTIRRRLRAGWPHSDSVRHVDPLEAARIERQCNQPA
jgi:hypothetical protein